MEWIGVPCQVVMARVKIFARVHASRLILPASAGTEWKKEMAPSWKGTWMYSMPALVSAVWSVALTGMSPDPKWFQGVYAGVLDAPMNSYWPVLEPTARYVIDMGTMARSSRMSIAFQKNFCGLVVPEP